MPAACSQAALARADSAAAALALEGAAPGIERRRASQRGQTRHSFSGLADLERAPGQFLAVEGLDGSGSFFLRLEFDEGETARPAGGAVERQNHIRDGTDRPEQIEKILAGTVEAEISDESFA